MGTSPGSFTPTRVPKGVLNVTVHFQSSMGDGLGGLKGTICLTCVNDIVIWARDDAELVRRVDLALGVLMDRGMFSAAHKAVVKRKEVKWCGGIYSRMQARHDSKQVEPLLNVRWPTTAGELLPFCRQSTGSGQRRLTSHSWFDHCKACWKTCYKEGNETNTAQTGG